MASVLSYEFETLMCMPLVFQPHQKVAELLHCVLVSPPMSVLAVSLCSPEIPCMPCYINIPMAEEAAHHTVPCSPTVTQRVDPVPVVPLNLVTYLRNLCLPLPFFPTRPRHTTLPSNSPNSMHIHLIAKTSKLKAYASKTSSSPPRESWEPCLIGSAEAEDQ